ncbi:MAG: hypothetical protein OYH77_08555 [Pseudomonadota bacterium]|nr:hypothetical protein [Pseudomonadota bacterium]
MKCHHTLIAALEVGAAAMAVATALGGDVSKIRAFCKHKWVKKVLSYTIAIAVGALALSWMQSVAKQGAYAEIKATQVDMDCFKTFKKQRGDEV